MTKYKLQLRAYYILNHALCKGVYPGFGRGGGGGGQEIFFFQIWKFSCRQALVAYPLSGKSMRFARDFFLNSAIWFVLVYIWIRFSL